MVKLAPWLARRTASAGAAVRRPQAIRIPGQGGASCTPPGARVDKDLGHMAGGSDLQGARISIRRTSGANPKASARPMLCVSLPGLPSLSTQQPAPASRSRPLMAPNYRADTPR